MKSGRRNCNQSSAIGAELMVLGREWGD